MNGSDPKQIARELDCSLAPVREGGFVSVQAHRDGEHLHLRIEDDGVGFDPEAVSQRVKRGEHLGLLGMTERVRSAGGTINLNSRPGEGSRIEVVVPFARPSPVPVQEPVPPS